MIKSKKFIFRNSISLKFKWSNSEIKLNKINNFHNLPKKNFASDVSKMINKPNYIYSIYENCDHFLKYKEKYISRMEKENFFNREDIINLRNTENKANLIFSIKYFTTRKSNLLRNIREFFHYYNLLDDRFIFLLLKKIMGDIKQTDFEDIDKLSLIILKKGITDFEILNQFKKILIFDSSRYSYGNLGNILIIADQIGIITNDDYIKKYYSEFIISGLIKLNYNDILFSFDGLSKIKNIDPYVWQIIESFTVKKFNKLYKINSLRRLVSILSSKDVKDTIFWNLTDKYILYNIEKFHQFHVILEIACHLFKNLGFCSLAKNTIEKFFAYTLARKNFKEFKILLIALEYIDFNTNIDNPYNINDKTSKNSFRANNIEKVKSNFKVCLETNVEELEFEHIDVLFEKDNELIKYFNTAAINEKKFENFLKRVSTFSLIQKYKIFFSMAKYDNRFNDNAKFLIISSKSSNINLDLNEFNYMLMIEYMKNYENEENSNIQLLLDSVKNNFNQILNEDIDKKYYELLIILIPYFPNILKYLDTSIKKKKLNGIINSFIEYKYEILTEKITKNDVENKNQASDITDLVEFVIQEYDINYDKLILIRILDNLNSKKLNLNENQSQFVNNSDSIIVDISKSSLIQIIQLCYNFSLNDLEKIYKMKFYNSEYEKFINV